MLAKQDDFASSDKYEINAIHLLSGDGCANQFELSSKVSLLISPIRLHSPYLHMSSSVRIKINIYLPSEE
jgi:hypothetical protein